jgi:hypothetical protein
MLVKFMEQKFRVTIGRITVSENQKKSDHWLSLPPEFADHTPARTSRQQQLESALHLWSTDVRSTGATLSDDILIEKAQTVGDQLGVRDFAYSKSWLTRFKSRHNIKSYKVHGESSSADMTLVSDGIEKLKQYLARYDPEYIYNVDESALFHKLKPSSTLATGPVQ